MMAGSNDLEALRAAVYLFHLPAGIRSAREQPLPFGVPLLLEIAAGDEVAAAASADRLERPVGVVREAAEFFIEHVVMDPAADAFRTLGSERAATDVELRRNMAMLLRWAHPDVDPKGDRNVFAGRITRAWEAVKTPERRAAYEAANPPRKTRTSKSSRSARARSSGGHASGWMDHMPQRPPSRVRMLLDRALRFLVVR